MPKQNNSIRKPNIWDYVSIISAVVFTLFLILNIYNRLIIIDILSKKSAGGVGSDAPVLYPLSVGVIAAGLSLYASRAKTSKLWLVAVTVLLVGILIWVFGLRHALQNTFMLDIPK